MGELFYADNILKLHKRNERIEDVPLLFLISSVLKSSARM